MRLERLFYKLPLLVEVERLKWEMGQFGAEDWTPNPAGFKGNDAMVLVSVGGKDNDDFACVGPMEPTARLRRCPYVQQVMAALEAPISRARLMRIQGGEEAPWHRDLIYHWYRRTRVHIPIVTSPEAVFYCGDAAVNMAAGEVWTFDNFKQHRVVNGGKEARIHLVIDTKGSQKFNALLEHAAVLPDNGSSAVTPQMVTYQSDWDGKIELEEYTLDIMSPSELDHWTGVFLNDAAICDGSTTGARVAEAIGELRREWKETYDNQGQKPAAIGAYRSVIERFGGAMDGVKPRGESLMGWRMISTMLRER